MSQVEKEQRSIAKVGELVASNGREDGSEPIYSERLLFCDLFTSFLFFPDSSQLFANEIGGNPVVVQCSVLRHDAGKCSFDRFHLPSEVVEVAKVRRDGLRVGWQRRKLHGSAPALKRRPIEAVRALRSV